MQLTKNHCPFVLQSAFASEVDIERQLSMTVEFVPCYEIKLESHPMHSVFSSWRRRDTSRLLGCFLRSYPGQYARYTPICATSK